MHVVPKAQLLFVPAPTRSALSFSGWAWSLIWHPEMGSHIQWALLTTAA